MPTKISAKVPINSASNGRSLATRRCNQIVHALTTLFVDASKAPIFRVLIIEVSPELRCTGRALAAPARCRSNRLRNSDIFPVVPEPAGLLHPFYQRADRPRLPYSMRGE